MHILFLCGREVNYPLNQVLLQCFRQIGEVDVVAEHGSGRSIIRRSAQVLAGTLPRLLSRRYDLVFVGFYGQLLMLPVSFLTRQPLLFHPFISTYETLVAERRKAGKRSLLGRTAFWLDRTACRRADGLVLDTQVNIEYFSKTFGLPESKFSLVRIGSDENLFYPCPDVREEPIVIYHGSYLPLQGIEVVVRAASRLDGRTAVRFRMLGRGLEYERIRRLAKDLGAANIDFLPPVPVEGLPAQIAPAMLCLGGHFGASEKAARFIAGKTFQDLAMGKATIVGDNPANHELLTHGVDAWFCPMNDAEALAEGIRALVGDPALRARLGHNARQTFLEKASLKVVQAQVKQAVDALIGSPA